MAVQFSDAVRAAIDETLRIHQEHAIRLGDICIVWAVIDSQIDDLLALMLRLDPAQVACIATSADRVASRCQMLIKLAVIEPLDPDWRAWLTGLLNRTQGELADLRNRYVHDRWFLRSGRIVRTDKRATVAKAQSRQPAALQFNREHVTDPSEMSRLLWCLEAMSFALAVAGDDLQRGRETGQPVTPDPIWLPAAQPRARVRTDEERAEAARQGQTLSLLVVDPA